MHPTADPAWIHLRAHHEGTLAADGVVEKTRFILDGAAGRVVFPVHPSVLEAEELVLFTPEEAPPMGLELQLLLSGTPIDADSEPADRWKACHGDPRQPRWLACEILGGKFDGRVIEPEALQLPNPLRGVEPKMCKRLNADKAALAALCEKGAGIAVREPLAVGVDPTGVDVRARFGVVHVPFPTLAWTAEEAQRHLDAMLGTTA